MGIQAEHSTDPWEIVVGVKCDQEGCTIEQTFRYTYPKLSSLDMTPEGAAKSDCANAGWLWWDHSTPVGTSLLCPGHHEEVNHPY